MILLGLFAVVVGLWFVFPFVAKKIQIRRLRRYCRARRSIVLTYDDGPGAMMTRKLLDVLNSRGAVATFFVIGHKVDTFKDEISAIARAGHEVGSHSYRHLHAWKSTPVSVFMDIDRGLRAVGKEAPSRLFRAPYGKTTLGTLLQLAVLGWKQSWWTIDSSDTWESPRDIGQILDQVRRDGGGVILLHDMDRPGQPEREAFVLDVTCALLDLAETEKFRICTLGEVLNA